MFIFKSLLDMPRGEALAVVVALIGAMGYTIISLGWLPHMSIIAAITILILYGLARGLKYNDMQTGMVGAVGQGMGAIYLFFFIGLMVSALMMSGAIPTLMYYGFRADFPYLFLFFCFRAVFHYRRIHRQQFDHLRHRRRCLYGHGGGVSCRFGDDGGRDCFRRVFRRQNVPALRYYGYFGFYRLH